MLKNIISNNDINIKEKSSILDIGCGTGNAINLMNKLNPRANILGIDLSIDMVLFSNKKYKENNKLNFKHIDISQLNNNEYSKKFDLVTTFNVLHWIPNLNLALKNIYNSMMINSDFTGIYFLENRKILDLKKIQVKEMKIISNFSEYSNFKKCFESWIIYFKLLT